MIGARCSPYIDRGVLLIEHEVCIVSKAATARRMGGAIVADGAEYHVKYKIALHFGWGGVEVGCQCQHSCPNAVSALVRM